MLKGKIFLDYGNLYFSNEYEKNDKIIVTQNWMFSLLMDSNSPFASVLGIPIGITSSAIWLKLCAITEKLKILSQ